MFNLQPGQGLGFTASRLIAFGLGSVKGIAAALLAVARKIFKREKYIVFQREAVDAFTQREPVFVYFHTERDTFERRAEIERFFYARKCDERR